MAGIKTHKKVELKTHIVTWNDSAKDFWVKELPGNLTDDEIYKYINANLTGQPIKVYKGREIIIRGRRT